MMEPTMRTTTAATTQGSATDMEKCLHGTPMEVRGKAFDGERALYGSHGMRLVDVTFGGPADGESPLKEARDVRVSNGMFSLRYPLWHASGFSLSDCVFDAGCRAPIWYSEDGEIRNSRLLGPKAIRECRGMSMSGCAVESDEFGWMSSDLSLRDVTLAGEYAFLHSSGIVASGLWFSGKYSFQYVQDAIIEDSVLDTKDAFWHSKNVTVVDSVLRGEYLGWYSEGLTLVRCRIEGTQPFVRCDNLRLIDCEMIGCDLAFEGSSVDATVNGGIDSIRDPRAGRIVADGIGEVVRDTIGGCGAEIICRGRAEVTSEPLRHPLG